MYPPLPTATNTKWSCPRFSLVASPDVGRNDLTGSFFKIPFCSQDCYNVQMNIEHCYRQNSSFMPY